MGPPVVVEEKGVRRVSDPARVFNRDIPPGSEIRLGAWVYTPNRGSSLGASGGMI